LGIKAVIAESLERIHRSNLIGMGVLPLTFEENENAATLGLRGDEVYDIEIPSEPQPKQKLNVTATDKDGKSKVFKVTCRLDNTVEVEYYRNGGVLHTVLRRMV
jgi:aconitate hydratase